MTSEFEIEVAESGDRTLVIRARGPLDAKGAALLTRRCAEVRETGRHLVLNLSAVTFVASSGVGALLALVEEFRQSTCRLKIAEASSAVVSVVRLLNLEPFLSLGPSERDAVAQLEAAGGAPEEHAA